MREKRRRALKSVFALVLAATALGAAAAGVSPALAGVSTAVFSPPPPPEAGAAAPPNCWYMPGACAAGTSVALTAPIEGPVAPAWSFQPGGEVVSEPLVWDNRVAVEVLTGKQTRELHLLDLETGRPVCPPLDAGVSPPLAPVLWRSIVLIRHQGTQLRAYRILPAGFEEIWRCSSPVPFAAPLLHGTEIYAAAGEHFMRLDLLRGERRVWSDRAGEKWQFYGRPALRGDHVYAVGYNFIGQACLVQYERAGGARVNSFPVENFLGFKPELYDEIRISVFAGEIVVHYPRPPALVGGREAAHFGQKRLKEKAGTTQLLHMWMRHQVAAAEWRNGWVGFLVDQDNGPMWLAKEDTFADSALVLSSRDHHPDLIESPVDPSVASSVAYVGGLAFDLETRRILWQLPYRTRHRAVPARKSLLLVEESGRLICVREQAPPGAAAAEGLRDRSWASGRAVLRDGAVLTGDFEIEAASQRLIRSLRRGEKQSWPLAGVLCAETESHEIVLAANPADAAWGVGFLIGNLQGSGFAGLAEKARGARSAELLRRVLSRNVLEGAVSREALAEDAALLEELEAQPDGTDQLLLERALADESALDALPADAYWIRAQRTARSEPDVALALLRAALERKPDHAGAAGLVRSLIPSEITMPAGTDPLEWLSLAEVLNQESIRVVPPPGIGRMTAAQRRVAEARESWRPDLQAFQSRHLLIVTPLAAPGAAARCLSLGELICLSLDEIIPPDALPYRLDEPLLLYLYESREEYLRESEGEAGEDNAGLEWTAGHYSLTDNLSRIYIPEPTEASSDVIREVLRTYAHELTHHWLAARTAGGRLSPAILKRRGYWLVEGFASFVEEFRFDPKARTYDPFNPRASRLDLVANARPEQLIDWGTVFGSSAISFQETSAQASTRIPSTWYLGAMQIVGPRHLFYNQAAAACHYAYHAENGRHRSSLIEALRDFYLGRGDGIDAAKCFDAPPAELGARIAAYTRAVQREAR